MLRPPPTSTLFPYTTLFRSVRSAREAFAAAADLDELAAVKPTHLGDGSPVLRARRMIGSLDAKDRAAAGKRVNEARQAIQSAYGERLALLRAELEEEVLP